MSKYYRMRYLIGHINQCNKLRKASYLLNEMYGDMWDDRNDTQRSEIADCQLRLILLGCPIENIPQIWDPEI